MLKNQIPKSYVDYDLYYNLVPDESPDYPYFDQLPRLGALEVSYKGNVSTNSLTLQLIFSKLLSKTWPNIMLVADKCAGMVEALMRGDDHTPFLSTALKTYDPDKQKSPGDSSPARSRFTSQKHDSPKRTTSTKKKQLQPALKSPVEVSRRPEQRTLAFEESSPQKGGAVESTAKPPPPPVEEVKQAPPAPPPVQAQPQTPPQPV